MIYSQRLLVTVAVSSALAGAAEAATLGGELVETKLAAADGAAADRFGFSAALSGAAAVIGAYDASPNGTKSGAAYLFDAATGLSTAVLTPSDAAAYDGFGVSVAVSGGTAVVGAFNADASAVDSGAAYLFDAATGAEITKLTPTDAAAYDRFGVSVGISGDTAIVGAHLADTKGSASGSAYLFDATTGAQTHKLTASDGRAQASFGQAVALSGAVAIVGAPEDSGAFYASGSAYLFDASTGAQIAKLSASDAAANDYFGGAVAVAGTTAIVGAAGDDDKGAASGSAYVFDTATGQQIAKLIAPDGAAGDGFGASVAIFDGIVAVGAYAHDAGGVSDAGAVYLFDAVDGGFLQKITASDGAAVDRFGAAVALSNAGLLSGASYADGAGSATGAAYLYTAEPLGAGVSPVPLPGAAVFLLSALGVLIAGRRRSALFFR